VYTHGSQKDDDGDVFAEDVVLHVELVLLEDNITLGFTLVGRTAAASQISEKPKWYAPRTKKTTHLVTDA
jgi:hypothetical protein